MLIVYFFFSQFQYCYSFYCVKLLIIFFKQRITNLLLFYNDSAPGAYDVEKADKNVHGSSPAYSIKGKPKEREPEQMPGNIDLSTLQKKKKCLHKISIYLVYLII